MALTVLRAVGGTWPAIFLIPHLSPAATDALDRSLHLLQHLLRPWHCRPAPPALLLTRHPQSSKQLMSQVVLFRRPPYPLLFFPLCTCPCVCLGYCVLPGQHLTWARDHIIHTPSPLPPALYGGRGVVHVFVVGAAAAAADNIPASAAAAARLRDLPEGSRAVLAWAGDADGFGVMCNGLPPEALLAVLITGDNDDDYVDDDAGGSSSSSARSFMASCPGILN
jgi:hypothetical protein